MRAGLRVVIVTPAPRGSRAGNRVTAERWARILRSLGARARVAEAWSGQPADVLVAIHATKSAASIRAFAEAHPSRAVIVLIAGTDVSSGRRRAALRESLRLATRLIVLHPLALEALPASVRAKARVIRQSAPRPRRRAKRSAAARFEVAVLSHLRPVKDPLRAAKAARLLPAVSRIVVLHAGRALSQATAGAARAEMARNPRYRWLGELSRARAQSLLARCRVMVLSSRSEGGASALSEAAVAGMPILCTRIPGTVGLLGADHPGLFDVGDTRALAALLERCENDVRFRDRVGRSSRRLAPLLAPARERAAWKSLLEDVT